MESKNHSIYMIHYENEKETSVNINRSQTD